MFLALKIGTLKHGRLRHWTLLLEQGFLVLLQTSLYQGVRNEESSDKSNFYSPSHDATPAGSFLLLPPKSVYLFGWKFPSNEDYTSMERAVCPQDEHTFQLVLEVHRLHLHNQPLSARTYHGKRLPIEDQLRFDSVFVDPRPVPLIVQATMMRITRYL